MSNAATPKRASVFHEADGNLKDRWIYKWDTGELSVIAVPKDFHFDPAASVPLLSVPQTQLDN